MAGSLNKVCLIGNVGKDPDIRSTQAGGKIVNLSIATEESWKDKASGEKKSRTEWHRVVIFNPHLAAVAEQYVKKGSKVYLEGALQTRKWTDQGGVERYSTEVVIAQFGGTLLLLSKQEGGSQPANEPRQSYASTKAGSSQQQSYDLDDDIPF